MADLGEGPRGPRPPLILGKKRRNKRRKVRGEGREGAYSRGGWALILNLGQ